MDWRRWFATTAQDRHLAKVHQPPLRRHGNRRSGQRPSAGFLFLPPTSPRSDLHTARFGSPLRALRWVQVSSGVVSRPQPPLHVSEVDETRFRQARRPEVGLGAEVQLPVSQPTSARPTHSLRGASLLLIAPLRYLILFHVCDRFCGGVKGPDLFGRCVVLEPRGAVSSLGTGSVG